MTFSAAIKSDAKPWRMRVDKFFDDQRMNRAIDWLLLAYCLAAGLSIAVSQIAAVSFVVLWLSKIAHQRCAKTNGQVNQNLPVDPHILIFAVPLISWFAATLVASLTGINTTKALLEMLRSSVYLLFPFSICFFLVDHADGVDAGKLLARITRYFIALTASLCLAGLHSALSAAAGYEIKPRIPGAVTESGQLALVLPLLVSLCFVASRQRLEQAQDVLCEKDGYRARWMKPIAFFFFVMVFAWPGVIHRGNGSHWSLLIRSLAACGALMGVFVTFWQYIKLPKQLRSALPHDILRLACALLIAVLIINLKRGPWLGIVVSFIVFGLLFSRRLFAGTAGAVVFALLFFEPARARLFALFQDFVISGGRKSMWLLGLEIVERFPLGLGLGNANFMRKLDPSLPYMHRHMHNNLLNVAVESGLIGLGAYIWWMVAAIGLGFALFRKMANSQDSASRQIRILLLGLSCSLLSWQVAGLVEYNFGDGEVRLLALFLMGALLALASRDISQGDIAAQ